MLRGYILKALLAAKLLPFTACDHINIWNHATGQSDKQTWAYNIT